MAATKRATKKGGAAKKGGAKKGGSKKGGAKKGGALSFGSVVSGIGSVASAVGGIAGRRDLRVGVGRNAGINDIMTALKKKFREAGCPGCRSGIDRIVLEDILAGGGGGR